MAKILSAGTLNPEHMITLKLNTKFLQTYNLQLCFLFLLTGFVRLDSRALSNGIGYIVQTGSISTRPTGTGMFEQFCKYSPVCFSNLAAAQNKLSMKLIHGWELFYDLTFFPFWCLE